MTIEERVAHMSKVTWPNWTDKIGGEVLKNMQEAVAEAVEADRNTGEWFPKSYVEAERERHAAADERWQERLKKVESDHAQAVGFWASQCELREKALKLREADLERLSIELAEQGNRCQKHVEEADQRWQERMRAVEKGFEAKIATNLDAWRDVTTMEVATERANWQAHLERVEAEHNGERNRWTANRKGLFKEIWQLRNEGKGCGFWSYECKCKEEAVAAAYEKAAKLAEKRSIWKGHCPLAAAIRQLATKSQEANRAWEDGFEERATGPKKSLPFVYPVGVCGNPHCKECCPEGQEAPKTAAPGRYGLWRGRTIWLEPFISGWSTFVIDVAGWLE